ncbi:MAG: hypothetical protein ABIV50_14335 [Opitutus sp.]
MKTPRVIIYLFMGGFGLVLLVVAWSRFTSERTTSRSRPARQVSPQAREVSPVRVESAASAVTATDSQPNVRVKRIRELLAALEPVLPGERENKTALELLQWWAEFDPQGAIAYAQANPAIHGRAELPVELFVRWLNAEGDPVLAWATGLPRSELRSQLLPTVISLHAETRPLEALSMTSELTGENRRLALLSVFAEWSSADPARAAAEAQRLPTGEERTLAINQVIDRWADHDLPAAIEWVKHLPPSGDPGSVDLPIGPLEILLEKWTAQAPMEAARYLVSLPGDTRRIQMLTTAVGQWAEQNPRDALAWAAGLSGETDRTGAIRSVLTVVAESDAATAANLALTLPPGGDQQKSIQLIIEQWSALAPEKLTLWATLQLFDPSRRAALPAIVTAWAGADLPTLGDWLTALPAGSARDVCCAALARHLAPSQPDVARQWADRIGDDRLRAQPGLPHAQDAQSAKAE